MAIIHTTITFLMTNLPSEQELRMIKKRATREKATTGREIAQELKVERKMRKALLKVPPLWVEDVLFVDLSPEES